MKIKKLSHFFKLCQQVKNLPYGRNQNRDYKNVWLEQKGTCSSKHAFLKEIADKNYLHQVQLILGIYQMNHHNTPKIGDILVKNGLKYIPEAHCYLKINDNHHDFTSKESDFNKVAPFIIEEQIIEPQQTKNFKVKYHQRVLKNWIKVEGLNFSFEEVWKIREECILKLGE